MSDPSRAAIRAAQHAGVVPFVHTSGCVVSLVTRIARDAVNGETTGDVIWHVCASAGLARVVAARVLTDLRTFPEHGPQRGLALSVARAEAALRFARWRARRELAA